MASRWVTVRSPSSVGFVSVPFRAPTTTFSAWSANCWATAGHPTRNIQQQQQHVRKRGHAHREAGVLVHDAPRLRMTYNGILHWHLFRPYLWQQAYFPPGGLAHPNLAHTACMLVLEPTAPPPDASATTSRPDEAPLLPLRPPPPPPAAAAAAPPEPLCELPPPL